MKKIAYLILAHNDPSQLGRLCQALNDDYSDLFIHIDLNQDVQEFKDQVLADNVKFLRSRVHVNWGGISMIDAQNLLIEEALKSRQQYMYFVLLSGSCYPLKRGKDIHTILGSDHTKQYIKYIDMRQSKFQMNKITKKWFYDPIINYSKKGIVSRIEKRARKALTRLGLNNHWKENVIPYFGSQWWAMTPECCESGCPTQL